MDPKIELLIKARNEAKRALNELQKQLTELENRINRTGKSGRQFGSSLKGLNSPISGIIQGLGNLRLGAVGAGLALLEGGQRILEFGKQAVSAAAQMQTFRNTVRATESSAITTEQRLAELTALGKELVGIDTGGLLKFNSVLRSMGLETKTVDTILRGFVKAGAELGRSVADNSRVLLQFTQAVSVGKIQAQDLNTVFRELPQFQRAASAALGTTITNVESFRKAAQDAGITARDALIRSAEELNRITRGADLDSYTAQVERLGESWFQFQATLGELVVPALTKVVEVLNEGVEALDEMTKGTREFLTVQDETITSALEFRRQLELATDDRTFTRVISNRIKGLQQEQKEVDRGSVEYAKYHERIQNLIDLTRQNNVGQKARLALLKEEEEDLQKLLKRYEQKDSITLSEVAFLERQIPLQKRYVDSLKNLVTAFGGTVSAADKSTESTEKAETATRNFRKELAIAGGEFRKAQRILRSVQTAEDINQSAAEALDALQVLRQIRIDQAKATIKDKEELEARLAEITVEFNEKEEALVVAAIKMLSDLENEGYRKAEADYDDHLQRMERIRNQPRYGRPESGRTSPIVNLWSNFLLDQVDSALAQQRSQQAGQEAQRVEGDIAEEQPNALTRFLSPKLQAALRIADPELQSAIKRGAEAARAVEDKLSADQDARLKAETQTERDELRKRLQAQREFYNAVQELNFASVESFIQSAVKATTSYIQQLALRKAAEEAYSLINTGISSTLTSLGIGAGVLTGGTGLLAAGGVAIGAALLQSALSDDSSRIFHNAANDALVGMAVNRALTNRTTHQSRLDNRQQARDVASAVDEGIRTAPEQSQIDEQPQVIQFVMNDRIVQEYEITRKRLAKARRI